MEGCGLNKNFSETSFHCNYHFFHKSSDSKKSGLIFGSDFFRIRTGFNFLLPEKFIIHDAKYPKRELLKDEKVKLIGKY